MVLVSSDFSILEMAPENVGSYHQLSQQGGLQSNQQQHIELKTRVETMCGSLGKPVRSRWASF
jgi:hypothetical protein